MPEIVSDEYREGYTAFFLGGKNPYPIETLKWECWEDGWFAADLDWKELIGENYV